MRQGTRLAGALVVVVFVAVGCSSGSPSAHATPSSTFTASPKPLVMIESLLCREITIEGIPMLASLRAISDGQVDDGLAGSAARFSKDLDDTLTADPRQIRPSLSAPGERLVNAVMPISRTLQEGIVPSTADVEHFQATLEAVRNACGEAAGS